MEALCLLKVCADYDGSRRLKLMLDAGELGWVPENEILIQDIGQQLGRSAYGAVNGVLKQDTAEMEKYTEDLYVSAVLINRLGLDQLIGVLLDDNAAVLSEVHTYVTTDQIKEITKALLQKVITDYSAKCKEGNIPEQLQQIPVFDFRKS